MDGNRGNKRESYQAKNNNVATPKAKPLASPPPPARPKHADRLVEDETWEAGAPASESPTALDVGEETESVASEPLGGKRTA